MKQVFCLALALVASGVSAADAPKRPEVAGDWWQIAGDPDLGELTSPKQQLLFPFDRTIYLGLVTIACECRNLPVRARAHTSLTRALLKQQRLRSYS